MAANTREIIRNTRLSSTARLLLLWLRATAKNGVSHESNAAIGVTLGIRADTVSDVARELTEAGLVRREGSGKGSGSKSKRWVLLPPAPAPSFGPKRTPSREKE